MSLPITERILNFFPEFFITEGRDQIPATDKLNPPLKIEVEAEVTGEPKFPDLRSMGKNPVIGVFGANGKILGVIDDDYRLWLFFNVDETTAGKIVTSFWKKMADEEFVKELLKKKAKIYGIGGMPAKELNRTAKSIAGKYSSTLEIVEESIESILKVSTELDRLIEEASAGIRINIKSVKKTTMVAEPQEEEQGAEEAEGQEGDDEVRFEDLL